MSKVRSIGWVQAQLYGTLIITLVIAAVIGALRLYGFLAPSSLSNTKIINLGNGGWTGVFVVWLVFVLIFSFINAIFYLGKRAKSS